MGTSKLDIVILYDSEDAEEWKSYLANLIGLGTERLPINCHWMNIKGGLTEKNTTVDRPFHILTLFVSPKMLDILELDPNKKCLEHLLKSSKKIAVIRLGVTIDDLTSVVKGEYENTETWEMLEIGSSEPENQKMVADLMNLLQIARTPPKPLPRPKESQSQKRQNSTVVQSVCPERVKTTGEKVVVIFHKPQESSTVQVVFGDSGSTKMDTTQINPYCFEFNAPAHKPGKAKFYVYIDGNKACRQALRYMSPSKFAYTCPEYLCQALDIEGEDNLSCLDKTLSNIFTSSLPRDNSLSHILSPRNVLGSSDGRVSEDFLPTLLHFACYYGLQDLCTSIMDLPGSSITFDIRNCDNKSPLDLAREAQNDDLVEYIEAFLEMQDYVCLCEDMYMKMTTRTLGDGGYLDMRGAGEEVEPYIEGRVGPSHEEEGYIDADHSGARPQIDEVPECDDVCEEAKPKVPERKNRTANANTDIYATPVRKTSASHLPQEETIYPRDEEFFKPIPMNPHAMGSENLADTIEYMEMFKRNELDLADIERLYEAWIQRNRNLSSSLREKKAWIDGMKKEFYKKPQKKGFFGTSKEPEFVDLDIKHNVVPNKYTEWKPGRPQDYGYRPRDSLGSNRDSVNSISSEASTTSSSSRGSMLNQISELASSDSEPDERAPPVPRRTIIGRNPDNRKSLAEEVMQAYQSQRATKQVKSRLPPVPKQREPIRQTVSQPHPIKRT